MWQKLIYSNFVFLSPKVSTFYVFIFRIIFARTSYAATVVMGPTIYEAHNRVNVWDIKRGFSSKVITPYSTSIA